MVMMLRPGVIVPAEHNRKWTTVSGEVIKHELVDNRSFLEKWLAKKFPKTSVFNGSLHYMIAVFINEEEYSSALKTLKVTYINAHSNHIPAKVRLEVLRNELDTMYPLGSKVNVSFGISNPVDQFFTGTIPVRYKLEKS